MLLLEAFMIIIAPYPGFEDSTFEEHYPDRDTTINMPFNVILLASAMISRLYLIIRFGLSASRYRNSRMQRLCLINGTEATFMYSIKAFKNDRPYTFIVASLLVPLVVCGYALRMFERPMIPVSG